MQFPVATPPGAGETFAIAPGIKWLRMPLPLMVYHLGRKALLRSRKTGDAAVAPQAAGERTP